MVRPTRLGQEGFPSRRYGAEQELILAAPLLSVTATLLSPHIPGYEVVSAPLLLVTTTLVPPDAFAARIVSAPLLSVSATAIVPGIGFGLRPASLVVGCDIIDPFIPGFWKQTAPLLQVNADLLPTTQVKGRLEAAEVLSVITTLIQPQLSATIPATVLSVAATLLQPTLSVTLHPSPLFVSTEVVSPNHPIKPFVAPLVVTASTVQPILKATMFPAALNVVASLLDVVTESSRTLLASLLRVVGELKTAKSYIPVSAIYWVFNNLNPFVIEYWHNPGNWSETSGGPGGFGIPSPNSTVIFDGNGVGSMETTRDIVVGGIHAGSDYSGDLYFNSHDITLQGAIGEMYLHHSGRIAWRVIPYTDIPVVYLKGGLFSTNLSYDRWIYDAPTDIRGAPSLEFSEGSTEFIAAATNQMEHVGIQALAHVHATNSYNFWNSIDIDGHLQIDSEQRIYYYIGNSPDQHCNFNAGGQLTGGGGFFFYAFKNPDNAPYIDPAFSIDLTSDGGMGLYWSTHPRGPEYVLENRVWDCMIFLGSHQQSGDFRMPAGTWNTRGWKFEDTHNTFNTPDWRVTFEAPCILNVSDDGGFILFANGVEYDETLPGKFIFDTQDLEVHIGGRIWTIGEEDIEFVYLNNPENTWELIDSPGKPLGMNFTQLSLKGTVGRLTINRDPADFAVYNDAYLTGTTHFTSFQFNSGRYDPHEAAITVDEDCNVLPAALFAPYWWPPEKLFDDCRWDIGGNMAWAGTVGDLTRLEAELPWYINVKGPRAVADYMSPEWSDASEGTEICAVTSEDRGFNFNWYFGLAGPVGAANMECYVASYDVVSCYSPFAEGIDSYAPLYQTGRPEDHCP